ncbi:MAG TPA: SgcJ/EcaC family oxidoreductase [Candidatus Krumholzibacteria bacterium]|nr:SgcJ/EcaC family oxidoreductase [Candidatus Krumholzibacteria bacterium]
MRRAASWERARRLRLLLSLSLGSLLPAAGGALALRPARAEAEPAARGAVPRPLLVTVDDLPVASPGQHRDPDERERITRELLAVLAKHRIRAVGLVTWSNVHGPRDRRLLEQWLEAGHELGNHSDRHLDYTATDTTAYIADVESGRKELAAFLAAHDRKLRFFRFPFLREGDTVEKLRAMRRYLARTGQRNLPVTIDNEDWSFEAGWVEARRQSDAAARDSIAVEYQSQLRLEVRDHEALGDELFERPTPQILLLHANEIGTAQWDALFTGLARLGHHFAAADEVLADSVFAAAHEYVGRYGCSLWHRLDDARRRRGARDGIAQLLETSAAAWNRGDLEAFCADYAEDALFIAPSGVTRGRQAVLERYKKKYADHAAMGTLSFELVEIRLSAGMEASVLGSARPARVQSASVVARWSLAYPDKPTATGLTLLVLRPLGGGRWEILQDASM